MGPRGAMGDSSSEPAAQVRLTQPCLRHPPSARARWRWSGLLRQAETSVLASKVWKAVCPPAVTAFQAGPCHSPGPVPAHRCAASGIASARRDSETSALEQGKCLCETPEGVAGEEETRWLCLVSGSSLA